MEIRIVNHCDEDIFTKKVNEHLKNGYKISSTHCGFMNHIEYDFQTSFQAILVKEGKHEVANMETF